MDRTKTVVVDSEAIPSSLVRASRRLAHRVIARGVSMVLRPGAAYDQENFRRWERRGVHVTPVHFYSPIPDTQDLARGVRHERLPHGIDLRPEGQLALLHAAMDPLRAEHQSFMDAGEGFPAFPLVNQQFGGIDPFVYYSMVRHFRPAQIVEIGAGFSTIVGARAARRNETTRYTCIDPWAPEMVKRGLPGVRLIPERVQDVDASILTTLASNDILFIDGSHVVRAASDVVYLVLEVLPRLAPGVIVHVHDIYIPDDYPDELWFEQGMFWTEQYLLQAYLADNPRVEILFGSHWLAKVAPDALRQVFPSASFFDGASFWFRKR